MSQPYSIEIEAALIGLVQTLSLGRDAEADARFKSFEERWRNDKTHRAAETQMASPSGASTPLPQAVQKAEAKVYESRAHAFEAVTAAMAAYLSYRGLEEEARHKKERLKAFWEDRQAAKDEGQAEHDRIFIGHLRDHDVHPWHLDQLSMAAKAVLADLIRWYHHDTQFNNPDNPWQAIDELYANRTVKKPGDRCLEPRSVAAPPPPYRHRHVSDIYYRYGPKAEAGADALRQMSAEPATGPVFATVDDVKSPIHDTLASRWDSIDVGVLPYEIRARPAETATDRATALMQLPDVSSLRELAEEAHFGHNYVDSVEDHGDIYLAEMFLNQWSNRAQKSLTSNERLAWMFLLVAIRDPAGVGKRDKENRFDGLLLPGSDSSTVREVRLRETLNYLKATDSREPWQGTQPHVCLALRISLETRSATKHGA